MAWADTPASVRLPPVRRIVSLSNRTSCFPSRPEQAHFAGVASLKKQSVILRHDRVTPHQKNPPKTLGPTNAKANKNNTRIKDNILRIKLGRVQPRSPLLTPVTARVHGNRQIIRASEARDEKRHQNTHETARADGSGPQYRNRRPLEDCAFMILADSSIRMGTKRKAIDTTRQIHARKNANSAKATRDFPKHPQWLYATVVSVNKSEVLITIKMRRRRHRPCIKPSLKSR